METYQPTIWKSIEIDCISRDWKYSQYVETHKKLYCRGAICSESMYTQLRSVFHNEMELTFETLRSSTDRMNVS